MKAYYDSYPSKLQTIGNGSSFYRWNIQSTIIKSEDMNQDDRIEYTADEVIVWYPLSPNKITESVINELWPSNYEQKLINEYNAAILGVYDTETSDLKIQTYKNFLIERDLIKQQIDLDCKELGIY